MEVFVRRIACVLAAMLQCASSAAGIVHFTNPAPGEEGHFNWHWQGFENPETFENWLDITRPSTDQSHFANGNSVGQLFQGDPNFRNNGTENGADLAAVPGFAITKALVEGQPVDGHEFIDSLHHAGDFEGISYFPIGQVRYMGVLTESGNYGWIAVIRGVEGHHRYSFLALGWAYETTPGKGIDAGEVPAPGVFAFMIGSFLFGGSGRRRTAPEA